MPILSPLFSPVSMFFCCLSAGRFVLDLAFTSSKIVATRPVLLLVKVVFVICGSPCFLGKSVLGSVLRDKGAVVDMGRCKAVRNNK